MRKRQKEQLEKCIVLLEQLQQKLGELWEGCRFQEVAELLELSIGTADTLIKISEKERDKELEKRILPLLKEYVHKAKYLKEQIIKNETNNKFEEKLQVLKNILTDIRVQVQNHILAKIEVVFLPYKASMWDSLESVWKAAEEDEECDAYVIPIPYFEKNPDGSFGEMYYEGNLYPKYVPITHYEDYDFAGKNPDMIFIHNPYDEYNRVTSVHPFFYSKNLKQYTEKLVYIPYNMPGYTYNVKNVKYQTSGVFNSDVVILQSESLKRVYIENGINKDKIKVLGSPKIDAVINNNYQGEISKDWLEKSRGRKCILLNSSITTFLKREDWLNKICLLIEEIEKFQEIFLIWRPHPLLEATIKSMKPEYIHLYNQIMDRINMSKNMVMDISENIFPAMAFSDALISDSSSIIRQYIFTEKPILILTGKSKIESRIIFCDFFASYFLEDGFSINKFINIVLENKDFKRRERVKRAKKSLKNTDGSCGKKILIELKKELKEK